MTLNNPNLVFKVTAFFDTEYLTNGYRYGHSYYTIVTICTGYLFTLGRILN